MSEENFVDQESMVGDYFGDSEPLVYQDSGEPFGSNTTGHQPPNAQPAKIEETEVPKQEEVAPEKEASNPEPVQPEKPTETPEKDIIDDPFSFMETSENGEPKFNALSALDFLEKKQQSSLEVEAPQVNEEPEQVQQSNGEEISYEDAVRTNLNTGLDYIQEALNSGYTMDQAYIYAKQQVDMQVKDHLLNKRFQDQEKSFEERLADKKAKLTHEQEMAELKPKSTANLYEMAKKGGYGSIEKLQSALMNPKYGGDMINYMFQRENKGQKYGSKEELASAMNDWFVKFTADKKGLAFLDEVAKSRIMLQRMPEIVEAVRSAKIKTDTSNSHGKSMSTPSVQNIERSQPASQGVSVEEYYGIDSV